MWIILIFAYNPWIMTIICGLLHNPQIMAVIRRLYHLKKIDVHLIDVLSKLQIIPTIRRL